MTDLELLCQEIEQADRYTRGKGGRSFIRRTFFQGTFVQEIFAQEIFVQIKRTLNIFFEFRDKERRQARKREKKSKQQKKKKDLKVGTLSY